MLRESDKIRVEVNFYISSAALVASQKGSILIDADYYLYRPYAISENTYRTEFVFKTKGGKSPRGLQM